MALQIETIPFILRSGSGSQTINHVQYPAMQAKAIVFSCSDNSGTNSEIYSTGFDDGTTRLSNGAGITETFGVSLSARGYSTVYSLQTEQAQAFFGGIQRRMSGYVSALNVGSFNIQLDLNNTPGAQWYATIIGGTDVSCKVGLYDLSVGDGLANVGFQPAALLILGVPDAGTNGEVAGALPSQGFATLCPNSDGDQAGYGIGAGPISSASASYQVAGVVMENLDYHGSISSPTSISGWDPNGFTLTVGGGGWNIGYLAIGGDAVSANLVRVDQPASTGIQNTAFQALDPVAAFFGSTNKPTASGVNTDANISFGVYDGFSQLSHWWGTVNGAGFPYKRDRITSTTNAITLATATGASTSTTNAAASADLSSENLALNWGTADSTVREIWVLVLANNPTPGESNPCGVNFSEADELTCSIIITAPAEIPSIGERQWRLHRFDAKFRGEQTS